MGGATNHTSLGHREEFFMQEVMSQVIEDEVKVIVW